MPVLFQNPGLYIPSAGTAPKRKKAREHQAPELFETSNPMELENWEIAEFYILFL